MGKGLDWIIDILAMFGLAQRDRIENWVSVERRLARDREKRRVGFNSSANDATEIGVYVEQTLRHLAEAKAAVVRDQRKVAEAAARAATAQKAGNAAAEQSALADVARWSAEIQKDETVVEEIQADYSAAVQNKQEAIDMLNDLSDDLAAQERDDGRLIARISRNNLAQKMLEARERMLGMFSGREENRFKDRIVAREVKREDWLNARKDVIDAQYVHRYGEVKSRRSAGELTGRAAEIYQQALAGAGFQTPQVTQAPPAQVEQEDVTSRQAAER